MNTNRFVVRTVITFIVLAIAGVSVAVSAKLVTGMFEQTVMVAIGSAMFGASLAFFLIRIFALTEK